MANESGTVSVNVQSLVDQLAAERAKNSDLIQALEQEKAKRIAAEDSLVSLRFKHQNIHNQVEAEEERFVNKLILKIDKAKKDKEKLANELEQEEEFLTNTLQKQLNFVKKEKEVVQEEVAELKRQLEHMKFDREKVARQVEAEEEFISNSFMKKLREVQGEKNELECRLWDRRGSRPSSLSQSRSSSFSIDLSVGSADGHLSHGVAAGLNSVSTDDDCTVVPHHNHQPLVHGFHFHGHHSNSAPSSLFSTPRDY